MAPNSEYSMTPADASTLMDMATLDLAMRREALDLYQIGRAHV